MHLREISKDLEKRIHPGVLCSLLLWVFPEVSSSKLQNTQLIKTEIETHSLMLVILRPHDQQSGINMVISHSIHYFL